MLRYFGAVALLLCALSGPQVPGQTRRALLIGINTYQPDRKSVV